MDRAQILATLDVAKTRGLEIGPLDRPLITRDMGPVEYIDRATREELQRWYAPNDKYRHDAFVEVDHVWGDETLLQCVGGQRVYDYLIASHVIEHVPDFFGWLNEVAAVLADGGQAVFAVPDKRFTFDILRRPSSEAEFVDAYVRGLRRPDPRQIFDHFYNFRDLGSPEIRAGASPRDVPPTHPPSEFLSLCRRSSEGGEYIDSHCWVFTPASMMVALDLGSQLDILPFQIAKLDHAPGAGEFLVVLRRMPDGLSAAERRQLFLESYAPIKAEVDASLLPPTPSPQAVAEAPAALESASDEIAMLGERLQAAEELLAAIQASKSWRITAPLRAVNAMVRGRR